MKYEQGYSNNQYNHPHGNGTSRRARWWASGYKFHIGKWNFTITLQNTLKWLLRLVALGICAMAVLFLIYAKDLPDPNKLLTRDVPQSTKIYAREGSLLYEIHGEYKRTLIPFDQMNDNIKNATVAIEDKNFYNESGINLRGILRSIYVDVFHFGLSQGGSTITQQFVRNAILTREKTFSRKVKEIILSLEINERFTKNDILKLYLNEIPYGRNAYGIEAAAQAYFGKHAKDLDIAEAAYLAALPQAPSYYSPSGPHRTSLDNRKNVVLQQMFGQGYINQDQYTKAKDEKVTFVKSRDQLVAPHFVLYIEDYLATKYGEKTLQTGGLKVTTTLDPKLQSIAENAVKTGVDTNAKKYNGNNAALVAIDPKTGQILAMVGSKDYYGDPTPPGCITGVNCTFEPDVNIATSERQPGSSGKPYVYATAFKPEFHQAPASMRMDVTTNFGTFGGKSYIPHNFSGKEYGPVSIRQALAGSLNIPAVKTLDLVGVDKAIQTMRDFGITSPLKNCGLSLVLGGCEVKLLDHTSGYATIASEGIHHQETGVLEIDDAKGNVLEKFQDQPTQVLDPQAAYELISIMTDNNARAFVFGAHSPLILSDRVVAAKTGTTQNFRDGWTLGFTPSLTAGVWVGNNDGTLLKSGADGVVVAAPIWHNFMQEALKGTPPEQFTVPTGIQHVLVDTVSGNLPNPYTPTTKSEVFASFSVPKDSETIHQVYSVPADAPAPSPSPNSPTPAPNSQPTSTGQSNNPLNNIIGGATDNGSGSSANNGSSSSGQTVNKLFTVFHSERPDNANWENPVVSWANAHGYAYPPPGAVPVYNGQVTSTGGTNPSSTPGNPPTVQITAPADGSTITNMPFTLQITATPDPNNKITRVDLLIDGTFVQSVNNAPYNFQINNNPGPGSHTFAAHAVDDKNNSADTSITLKFK